MKLLQINHAYDPALSSPDALLDRYHTLTGWSEAVHDAGCSVRVVQAFAADALVCRNDVEYAFCATGAGAKRFDALVSAARASDADIVHVNGFDAPRFVKVLRRALPPRVALVVQDHGGVRPRALSPWSLLASQDLRVADGYLFTTREQAEPWIRCRAIPDASTVHAVLEASTRFMAIDTAAARQRTGLNGTPAVLWVGRLDRNKDPLTVLAGFEQALGSMPGAMLTMAFGEEGLRAEVAARIEGSDVLRGRVRLLGSVPHDELAAYFSSADLFIAGSHVEAAGYALIEACACGATPVVTDIPPFRAITGNGAIGHHWRVGDAGACAAALRLAARHVGAETRRSVRAHFEAHLSWDQVGRRARAIYEVVLARRRSEG